MFRFVEWEIAGRLGPPPGRYAVRRFAGDEARHVVVIGEVAAPRPPGRRRPWARAGPPVAVTRAAVIDAQRVEEDDARAWLARAGAAEVAGALAVLNRTVHGHAVAAGDPYAAEVGPWSALATRLGYGAGDEVAAGRHTAVRELAAPAAPPRGAPAERLGALLAGRDVALAAETLALRVRLDLAADREREAALGLRTALEAALAELEGWREEPGLGTLIAEARGHAAGVAAAASAALEGGLDEGQRGEVAEGLAALEAALRARAASAQVRTP